MKHLKIIAATTMRNGSFKLFSWKGPLSGYELQNSAVGLH